MGTLSGELRATWLLGEKEKTRRGSLVGSTCSASSGGGGGGGGGAGGAPKSACKFLPGATMPGALMRRVRSIGEWELGAYPESSSPGSRVPQKDVGALVVADNI